MKPINGEKENWICFACGNPVFGFGVKIESVQYESPPSMGLAPRYINSTATLAICGVCLDAGIRLIEEAAK